MDHATQDDLVHLEVTVPGSLVTRIKAETGATVYEAVMAVLWRCRTRAAMSLSSQRQGDSDPESPAPFVFLCNMRTHAGARDGYYGNCVAVQMIPATKGAVAVSSIGDLVRLIRRAKEKAPHILSGGSSTGRVDGDHAAVTGGSALGEPPKPQIGWYDTLAVSSWRNLGFDKVDLGGGSGPARVMWYAERNSVPGCEVCPPCTLGKNKDDGGVSVSSSCVKMEHVEAFLGELTRLATSTLVA